MENFLKLIKSSGLYFVGTVGTKVINFLLTPLYTIYILPSDFGIYDANLTYATLISSFLFLDIWTGIMKFYFEKKNKMNVINSGLCIFISSSILYILIFLIFSLFVQIEYFYLVLLYGFSLCCSNLFVYLSRSLGYNKKFVISGIISTFINAGLNILFISMFHMDYYSLYLAFICGVLMQCIYLNRYIHVFEIIDFKKLDIELTKELLLFSLPLCLNSVFYWLLTGINKLILTNSIGPEANGYYAIAAKFSAIISILSSCFQLAWQEMSYQKYEINEQNKKFYEQAILNFISFIMFGYCILLPCINIIFPYLVAEQYYPAKSLIPLYLIANLASMISSFLGNIVSTYRKNNIIFISTFAASLVNIFVVCICIDTLSTNAASLGMFFGFVTGDIIRYFIIKNVLKTKISFIKLICPTLLMLLTIFIYINFDSRINFISIILISLIAIFCYKVEIKSIVMELKKKRIKKL